MVVIAEDRAKTETHLEKSQPLAELGGVFRKGAGFLNFEDRIVIIIYSFEQICYY